MKNYFVYIVSSLIVLLMAIFTTKHIKKIETIESNYFDFRKISEPLCEIVENLNNPNKLFLLKNQADKLLPFIDDLRKNPNPKHISETLERLSDTIKSNTIVDCNSYLAEYEKFNFDNNFDKFYKNISKLIDRVDSLQTIVKGKNTDQLTSANLDSCKSIVALLSSKNDSIFQLYKNEKVLRTNIINTTQTLKDENELLKSQVENLNHKIDSLRSVSSEYLTFTEYGIGLFSYIRFLENDTIIPLSSAPLSINNLGKIKKNLEKCHLVIQLMKGLEKNGCQATLINFETNTVINKFNNVGNFIDLPMVNYINKKHVIIFQPRNKNLNFKYLVNCSLEK